MIGTVLGGILQPVFIGNTLLFQSFEYALRIDSSGLTVKWQSASIRQV